MSMLTQPGMRGRKYRITGKRHPRMRPRTRRRRGAFLVVAAVCLLGLLGFGTVQLVDVFTDDGDGGDGGGTARAGVDATACATPGQAGNRQNDGDRPGQQLPANLPEADAITVNVYNATTRTGLAQDTADALEKRGFVIGEVDNAPEELDGKVEEPALLLGSQQAQDSGALAVVGSQVKDAETGDLTGDGGPREVDLVLGKGFTKLLSPAAANRELADLTSQQAAQQPADGQDC